LSSNVSKPRKKPLPNDGYRVKKVWQFAISKPLGPPCCATIGDRHVDAKLFPDKRCGIYVSGNFELVE
jgi:hypothetical protein